MLRSHLVSHPHPVFTTLIATSFTTLVVMLALRLLHSNESYSPMPPTNPTFVHPALPCPQLILISSTPGRVPLSTPGGVPQFFSSTPGGIESRRRTSVLGVSCLPIHIWFAFPLCPYIYVFLSWPQDRSLCFYIYLVVEQLTRTYILWLLRKGLGRGWESLRGAQEALFLHFSIDIVCVCVYNHYILCRCT